MKKLLCYLSIALLLGGVIFTAICCSDDSDDSDNKKIALVLASQKKSTSSNENTGSTDNGNTDNGNTGNNNENNGETLATFKVEDNEEGCIACGGTVKADSSKNAGNGKFLEGFSADKATLQYSINASVQGDYTLTIRYAFGGWCDNLRDAYITVNGVQQGDIVAFDYTASKWNVWEDKVVPITLNAGDNNIRIDAAIGNRRQFVMPENTGGTNPNLNSGAKPGDTITGVTAGLPNIDYVVFSATVKGAILKAGGKNATNYFRINATSELESAGTVTVAHDTSTTNKVTVTAVPCTGYTFDSYTGDVASTSNPYTFTMTQDTKLIAHFIPTDYTKNTSLYGYATIAKEGTSASDSVPYTITGGAGGEAITISSLQDFTTNATKISGNTPYIITISGTITTSDDKSIVVNVGANKTIFGDSTNQGRLKNIEMRISGDNVIVRNMMFGEVIAYDTIKGAGNDALAINGARFVWVDHCEFQSHLTPLKNDGTAATNTLNDADFAKDWYDGLLDIKNGSSFITVSNCYFHDHYKACLCGSSDRDVSGDDKMRITFYNNYWKDINARQPLFRWGKAHILNSVFVSEAQEMKNDSNNWNATAVNARAGSVVCVEGNTFTNIKTPVGYYNEVGASNTGTWNIKNNSGIDSSIQATSTWTPPYNYTAPTSAMTEANILTTVGVGKITSWQN